MRLVFLGKIFKFELFFCSFGSVFRINFDDFMETLNKFEKELLLDNMFDDLIEAVDFSPSFIIESLMFSLLAFVILNFFVSAKPKYGFAKLLLFKGSYFS